MQCRIIQDNNWKKGVISFLLDFCIKSYLIVVTKAKDSPPHYSTWQSHVGYKRAFISRHPYHSIRLSWRINKNLKNHVEVHFCSDSLGYNGLCYWSCGPLQSQLQWSRWQHRIWYGRIGPGMCIEHWHPKLETHLRQRQSREVRRHLR